MKKLILFFLFLYFVACLTFYINQESYVFRSSDWWRPPPMDLNVEELYINVEENIKLHTWLLKKPNSQRTIIFFHGNGGNITERLWQLDIFDKLNVQTILFDYRGYGLSDGKIKSIDELYNDSRYVYNYVVDSLNVPQDQIILWGRSLGGAIASKLASEVKTAQSLILEGTFSEIEPLVYQVLPFTNFLPMSLLFKYFDFNNVRNVKNFKNDMLILHSINDDLISYKHAEEIFDACNSCNAELVELKGTHRRYQFESYDKYYKSLENFLTK